MSTHQPRGPSRCFSCGPGEARGGRRPEGRGARPRTRERKGDGKEGLRRVREKGAAAGGAEEGRMTLAVASTAATTSHPPILADQFVLGRFEGPPVLVQDRLQ